LFSTGFVSIAEFLVISIESVPFRGVANPSDKSAAFVADQDIIDFSVLDRILRHGLAFSAMQYVVFAVKRGIFNAPILNGSLDWKEYFATTAEARDTLGISAIVQT